MVPRMIADGFSIDVYCAYLNLPLAEEFLSEREGNRSMNTDSMLARHPSRLRSKSRPSRCVTYILPRLVWMAVAPAAMMVLSVLKVETRSEDLGRIDAAFLAIAFGVIALRWGTWLAGDKYDSFGGKTGMKGLVGFSCLILAVAGAFWLLASLIARQPMVH